MQSTYLKYFVNLDILKRHIAILSVNINLGNQYLFSPVCSYMPSTYAIKYTANLNLLELLLLLGSVCTSSCCDVRWMLVYTILISMSMCPSYSVFVISAISLLYRLVTHIYLQCQRQCVGSILAPCLHHIVATQVGHTPIHMHPQAQ